MYQSDCIVARFAAAVLERRLPPGAKLGEQLRRVFLPPGQRATGENPS